MAKISESWTALLRRAGWGDATTAARNENLKSSIMDFSLPLFPMGLEAPGGFIDIGANIGKWACAALSLFPRTPIHCFEPDPSSFAILQQKISKHSLANGHSVALGDHKSKGRLNIYRDTPLNSLLALRSKYEVLYDNALLSSIVVDVETLDSFAMNDLQDPIWMKVDVQGTEEGVLTGGIKTMSRVKVLMIEVLFSSMYEGDSNFWMLHQKLTSEFGFVLYNLGNLHRESGPELVWGDAVYVRPNLNVGEPIGGDAYAPSLRLTDL